MAMLKDSELLCPTRVAPAEFAHLWRPAFDGIELFQANIVHHRFDKHFHDAYTIGLNEGGQGRCFYRGSTCVNAPGSLNLLNPGEVHTGQAAAGQNWAFRNFYISIPLMAQLTAQMEWPKPAPQFRGPSAQSPELRPLFRRLFQTLNQPARLAQQSLMLALLSRLLCRHSEAGGTLPVVGKAPKAIATVRTYIETHYAENFSLETLSDIADLSPYYLIRSFRQQVGLPPHRYQCQIRLQQAKRALLTDQPLVNIATDAGFYDQSHLNRSFKRVFGVTPGQYRQGNSVQDCR